MEVEERERIDPAAWEQARMARVPVRDCPSCPGRMFRLPVYVASGRQWFDVECDGCGKVASAPSGKVLTPTLPDGTRLRRGGNWFRGLVERERDFRERAAGER